MVLSLTTSPTRQLYWNKFHIYLAFLTGISSVLRVLGYISGSGSLSRVSMDPAQETVKSEMDLV